VNDSQSAHRKQQTLAGMAVPAERTRPSRQDYWFIRRAVQTFAGKAEFPVVGDITLSAATGRGRLRLHQFAGADRTADGAGVLDYSVWRRDPDQQIGAPGELWNVKARRPHLGKPSSEYPVVGELRMDLSSGRGELQFWLFGYFVLERPPPRQEPPVPNP